MTTVQTEKIHVVVVDDNKDTLSNLKKLLSLEKDIEIVATASSGEEAVNLAVQYRPDVMLMDINMPGMDGIAASEAIHARVPGVEIVIMSVQAEADYLKRAMLAGAREFLVKPFSSDDLASALRKVYKRSLTRPSAAAPAPSPVATPAAAPARSAVVKPPPVAEPEPAAVSAPSVPAAPPASGKAGKVLAIFSANGGVGRSTIAVNLAIALRQDPRTKVALVDGSLRFGDVGVLLNLSSDRTIADVASSDGSVDTEILVDFMSSHSSGIKVLLAPPRPELADLVNGKIMRLILATLRNHFDYIVVDTFSSLDEITLTILDAADQILLLTTSEIPSIKNTRLFFEVAEELKYASEKTLLVLNKADPKSGVSPKDIQLSIKRPVYAVIDRDDRATTQAVQSGQPFVMTQKTSPASLSVFKLVSLLVPSQAEPRKPETPAHRIGFRR
ncbi:MAG: response regulator [Chloroflexi bacterium]|nr:response regulator [Chloroflexota bacterium]